MHVGVFDSFFQNMASTGLKTYLKLNADYPCPRAVFTDVDTAREHGHYAREHLYY